LRTFAGGRGYLAFPALLLTLAASAQTPNAAALAQKIDAHYNHLHSLQALYTEHYQGLGMDRTETGTLTLQKPGRMRWAYDSPTGKLFLLDGRDAIAYTPGDAQATRFPEKKLDDLRSPLRFLLGHTELTKELDNLTVTAGANDTYTLTGVPRGLSQRVRSLSLTVDAAGLIHILRIDEVDGAITTFTFTNIRENIPTTPAEFQFTPPPGVTVIDGAAPI
jgi:outer membrane lipoprotein carrier protein